MVMQSYDDNVLVVQGSSIETPYHPNKYSFSHMRLMFDQIEINTVKAMPSGDGLVTTMYGKNGMICIPTMNQGINGGINTDSSVAVVTPSEEARVYGNLPCAVRTEKGTIIPQLIVPGPNCTKADNGLVFGEDSSMAPRDALGYTWSAVKLSFGSSVSSGDGSSSSGSAIDYSFAEKRMCYGYRDDNMYVSNVGACVGDFDIPVKMPRAYKCDLGQSYAGTGAFALCYKLFEPDNVVDKSTPAASSSSGSSSGGNNDDKQGPHMQFTIESGKKGATLVVDPETNTQVDPSKKDIVVTVDANGGGVQVVAGGVVEEMNASMPQNDLFPPQCRLNCDGEYALQCIYFYPTYYGLVITNSIRKNAESGAEGKVMCNPELVKSPWNNLTVMCSGSSAYNEEMNKYLGLNRGADLEFFPTILHQNADKPTSVRLMVRDGDYVKFGKNAKIVFDKCCGYWAYCPLYFHRNMEFTLFFKGEYVSEGESPAFTYYVFPLAVIVGDVAADDDEQGDLPGWDGITKSGAKAITASLFQKDDERQEAIYKAEFKFTSRGDMQRYPVEVFGAEIVMKRTGFQFQHKNANGVFGLHETGGLIKTKYETLLEIQSEMGRSYIELIRNMSVTAGLDGVSGSLTLDGYILRQDIGTLMQSQSIGEVDLDVCLLNDENPDSSHHGNNPNPGVFRGFGLELSTNGSEGDYSIGVKLEGMQRKLEDLKLVCAPFWDGDRLEAICHYFEEYTKAKIKMINYQVSSISNAIPVNDNPLGMTGKWKAKEINTDDVNKAKSADFRVPRSFSWASPAVNFQTGTSCWEALQKLSDYTGCVCTVGLDGVVYFYELNTVGVPYYIKNQITHGNFVTFDVRDIVSFNLSPSLENKYNSIATFGFIRKQTERSGDDTPKDNVSPGVFYTLIEPGDSRAGQAVFPWARANVGVENGFQTKTELERMHNNRVLFSSTDKYQGTMQVMGNTRVTHMYQVIRIGNTYFFVTNISHSIDLERKNWTTSYQVGLVTSDMLAAD